MNKRIIPPKSKKAFYIFPNFKITIIDFFYVIGVLAFIIPIYNSELNIKIKLFFCLVLLLVSIIGITKVEEMSTYKFFFRIIKYVFQKKIIPPINFKEKNKIKFYENYIKIQGLFSGIIEIEGINFAILNESKQNQIITILSQIYKISPTSKLIKFDKSINYDEYILQTDERINALKSKDKIKFKKHIEILENQKQELIYNNEEGMQKISKFYFIIFDSNQNNLQEKLIDIKNTILDAGLLSNILENNEIKEVYESYYEKKFDENDNFITSLIKEKTNTLIIDDKIYSILSIRKMPFYCYNGWFADLFSIPEIKICINTSKNNSLEKTLKNIDNIISESKIEYLNAGTRESLKSEIEYSLMAYEQLIIDLKINSDELLEFSVFIIVPIALQKEVINRLKKNNLIPTKLNFQQQIAYNNSQLYLSSNVIKHLLNPITTLTMASSFPFVSTVFMDKEGQYLAYYENPIFFDLFTSWKGFDPRRKNANLMCIGESGGGKSYFTKALNLANALDGKKIFLLDPEDEYSHMAKQLNGNIIDVGGYKNGIINPLHVFPALSDDSENNTAETYNHVSNHLQFLHEFFKITIMDLSKAAQTYLNYSLKLLYDNFNITDSTPNIDKIPPKKFPILNDLYILVENLAANAQKNNLNEYEQKALIELKLALWDFKDGSIYSKIWNGYTTLNLENNFNVFNFQSLFESNNQIIANGQMLLVVRFLMREVIKNKNENTLTGNNTNVVITIDEAHMFINPDYPVALNFMSTLVRRIRKYGGSMIITTQNIADFIGQTDRAKAQATAIINGCCYSTFFGLKPDGIDSIKNLYEKGGSGGLTELELNFIANSKQGEALFIVSSTTRFIGKIALYSNENNIIEKPKGL